MDNIKVNYIGKNIIHYEKIDSTQKEVWRQVEKKEIENGTVIVADIQTDAIGTHGRTWYTEKPNNIAFSIVLFPNCHIDKLKNLTFDIADILVNIFKRLYSVELHIKLPNDLMIRDRKVGGILTETRLQGNIVKTLVIGVGINTNQNEVVDEIKDIATSIKKEFKIEINNNDIINEFCNMLEKRLGE